MRNSFIFYRSFYESIKDLPRDIQGEIYTAIMEYGLNGNGTDNLKPVARSIFTLIKPIMDSNEKRYKNGCNGGRPRKENQNETEEKPKENQSETKIKPNDNVNEDVNVNEEDIIKLSCESVVKKESEKIDYNSIVEAFNNTLVPPLPKVLAISDARKRAIKARVNEHGIEAVKTVFNNVLQSKFLKGEEGNGWKCYFDWIFNPRNFLKILEGNYADNRANSSEKQRANEYAMQQFINDRIAREQGLVSEMEKPF